MEAGLRERFEDATLLALEMGGRAIAQEGRRPVGDGKSKGTSSPRVSGNTALSTL